MMDDLILSEQPGRFKFFFMDDLILSEQPGRFKFLSVNTTVTKRCFKWDWSVGDAIFTIHRFQTFLAEVLDEKMCIQALYISRETK